MRLVWAGPSLSSAAQASIARGIDATGQQAAEGTSIPDRTSAWSLSVSADPGGHDGTSDGWASWLVPQTATWQAP